jgi:hypothetical protein
VTPLAVCKALGFDGAVTNAEASFAMATTLAILALGDLVTCKPFPGVGPVTFGTQCVRHNVTCLLFPYDSIPHSPSPPSAEREVRDIVRERAPKEQSGRAAIQAVKSLYGDLKARFGAQHTTDAVFFAPVYRTLFC